MDTNEETSMTPEIDFGSIIKEFQDAASEADAVVPVHGQTRDFADIVGELMAAEAAAHTPAPEENAEAPAAEEGPQAAEAEPPAQADEPAEAPGETAAESPDTADVPEADETSEAAPEPTLIMSGLQPAQAKEEAPAAAPAETLQFSRAVPGEQADAAPDTAALTAMLQQMDPSEASSSPASPEKAEKASGDTIIRKPDKTASAETQKPAPKRSSGPIPLQRSEKLRELKRKLVAGPEKRYYELSEKGVMGMQIGMFVNTLLLLTAVGLIVLYTVTKIPLSRMKLMVFGQVLLMLLSGLVGCQVMIDGISDLLRLRFSLNTTLCISFLACIADAWFCLDELHLPDTVRMPCCSVFILTMEAALFARYQKRTTETAQMDTLRKSSRLIGLVREPEYYGKRAGILRTDAEVEDFMETYSKLSGPELVTRVYAAVAMIVCIGIAVIAGMLHSPSLACQVFSTSVLASVPACAFVATSRPAAILAKRLHMVGSVICGWKGVKELSKRNIFPLYDQDFLPRGSSKLNGIKFCSERTPAEVVSYSASLVLEAGGNLVPVFRSLMDGRNGVEYPIDSFQDYGIGGIGGVVNGETVLVGCLEFMRTMEISIPEDSVVDQAVYVAIGKELAAVVGISYSRMHSVTAGLVSVNSCFRLRSLANVCDFNLTPAFLREKFNIRSKRMIFPDAKEREVLAQKQPADDADVLAIASRDELFSLVYPVTGSIALRKASRTAVFISLLGGFIGLLIMGALSYLGSDDLLTPANVLLYQLIWLIPGLLATERARRV